MWSAVLVPSPDCSPNSGILTYRHRPFLLESFCNPKRMRPCNPADGTMTHTSHSLQDWRYASVFRGFCSSEPWRISSKVASQRKQGLCEFHAGKPHLWANSAQSPCTSNTNALNPRSAPAIAILSESVGRQDDPSCLLPGYLPSSSAARDHSITRYNGNRAHHPEHPVAETGFANCKCQVTLHGWEKPNGEHQQRIPRRPCI